MPFRCDARNFFITYPQSTDLPHEIVHDTLRRLDRVERVYSCRETHENGEFHHHAIVQFHQKFNCRNERHFDIDFGGRIFHPNVTAVRSIQASNDYVGKDGNTIGEPIPGTATARRDLYAELLADATDAKNFMELAEQRDAKNFVLNHDRLESFAIKRWGRFEEAQDPEYANDTFTNVPESMLDWVTNELNGGQPRPKNLIVVGGPELGKTCWAESLGRHHHWINRFTGSRVKDAKYAILDDFDTLDEHRHDFKGVWGSQKRIGVKISNGISGHRTWDWGIPSIWLFNSLPRCLWDEECYERQRSVLVEINRALY